MSSIDRSHESMSVRGSRGWVRVFSKSVLDRQHQHARECLVGSLLPQALEDLQDSCSGVRTISEHEDRTPSVCQPPRAGACTLSQLVETPQKRLTTSRAGFTGSDVPSRRGSPAQEPPHPLRAPRKQRIVPSPATTDIDGRRDVLGAREPPSVPAAEDRCVHPHSDAFPLGHQRARERPLGRIERPHHAMRPRYDWRSPGRRRSRCRSSPHHSAGGAFVTGFGGDPGRISG